MPNLETLTIIYAVSLLVLALALTVGQVTGYFRWQATVEKNGWPSIAALLFTMAVPLILAVIKLSI